MYLLVKGLMLTSVVPHTISCSITNSASGNTGYTVCINIVATSIDGNLSKTEILGSTTIHEET